MPGQAKLKLGGSPPGHNGLKDIHAQLGSADYWRLRLGIGHPGVKAEVINYVLKRPSPIDREAIDKSIEQSLSGTRSRPGRRDGAGDHEDQRAAAAAEAAEARSPSADGAADDPAGAADADIDKARRVMKALLPDSLAAGRCASPPRTVPAQTVFRCGNEYTRVPCAEGRRIDVSDR